MKNRLTRRSPWRRGVAVATVLLAVLLPACESDNSSSLPPVQRAVIVVEVTPNPVIGSQNGLTGSVSAAYVVTVREIAGLGGQIQFVNSTIFDPETGSQRATNYFDSSALIVFVGTDRVEPGGELDITQTMSYTLPDYRLEADLTVAVQFVDDRGALINSSILVPIVRPVVDPTD